MDPMRSATTKMTYDQLCLLPDDRQRHELFDGELIVTPAPRPRHQRILGRLHSKLTAWIEAHSLGEVFLAPLDVLFDEHTVLEPDILFIRQSRLDIIGEEAIQGAPDLVVEILSPSTFYYDLRKKMAVYSRFGVREYWIVDPEMQTIELHRLTDKGLQLDRRFSSPETFQSPLLPGFEMLVSSIF